MTELHLSSNNYYTVDPVYQWDLNQELKIYGVTISQPIIHFTNNSMGSSINRRPSVNSAGVLTVMIPNSMLQKTEPIIAYICGYVGETFKTFYKLEIPVKARKKPGDYTLEVSDDEVYSFNNLENKVNEAVADYEVKYQNVLDRVAKCEESSSTSEANATESLNEIKRLLSDYYTKSETLTDDVKTAYNLTAKATPTDVLNVIKNMLDEKAYYFEDTYVGGGAHGSNNPNSVTLNAIPKLMIISNKDTSTMTNAYIGIIIPGMQYGFSFNNVSSGQIFKLNVTVSDNTITWYCTEDPGEQLNMSAITYLYRAWM